MAGRRRGTRCAFPSMSPPSFLSTGFTDGLAAASSSVPQGKRGSRADKVRSSSLSFLPLAAPPLIRPSSVGRSSGAVFAGESLSARLVWRVFRRAAEGSGALSACTFHRSSGRPTLAFSAESSVSAASSPGRARLVRLSSSPNLSSRSSRGIVFLGRRSPSHLSVLRSSLFRPPAYGDRGAKGGCCCGYSSG